MKAQDLMTHEVCTCSPADSLEWAARLMWENDVGCLVVTDGGQKPIGMITDRDVAMATYLQGLLLRDAKVSSSMARTVVTCPPETSLAEIEATMQRARLRRIPVTGPNGRMLGIVTLGDIARGAQASALHIAETLGLATTLAVITERKPAHEAAQ